MATVELKRAIPDYVYEALDEYAKAERDAAITVARQASTTVLNLTLEWRAAARRILLAKIADAIEAARRN